MPNAFQEQVLLLSFEMCDVFFDGINPVSSSISLLFDHSANKHVRSFFIFMNTDLESVYQLKVVLCLQFYGLCSTGENVNHVTHVLGWVHVHLHAYVH